MSKFSQALGEEAPVVITNTLLEKIQELKRILNESQVNEAVRRYHFILKTLHGINFQVSLESDVFYQQIFYQALLEEKLNNPKGF